MSYLIILAFVGLIITSVAKRIHFSPELICVIVMGAVSFIPWVPDLEIDGDVVLEIILPPLLFSAARNLSGYKFAKLRTPILYLGVGMIFITALVVAWFTTLIAGFMTFTSGLILGAVVAPPDAVSSVSIGKKMHLPDKIMTILTGESLINDAASLTLFSFAVGIVYHQNNFISHPVLLFVWTCGIGIVIGVVGGFITLLVRKVLKEPNLIAVFTLLMPFAVYTWCEDIHGSGVLAVVAAGFVVERSSFTATHATRLQEQSLWRSVETLLDAFVFSFVGLQLRFIINSLQASELDTWWTIGVGLLVLLVVLIIRPIMVLGYNAVRLIIYKVSFKSVNKFDFNVSDKSTKRFKNRLENAPMSWREFTILSWTGMRGVVTLAAASSIPMKLSEQATVVPTSSEFKIHIFVQVVGLIVALGTLLIQGTTLPFLIKKILPPEIRDKDNLEGEWGKARKLMEQSALKVIENEAETDPDNFDKEHFEEVWKQLDTNQIGKNKRDISFVSQLLQEIVETQREDMQQAAIDGNVHPDVAKEYLDRLDHRIASFTTH
ncbi:MAG: sodium:proton antiporter [Candidatus Ancillula sp.]|jgi:CPA1 family monovalent cation:H+ antiporter|nr:sodium:proton antiporter [Candidatus Ancillula sp.]